MEELVLLPISQRLQTFVKQSESHGNILQVNGGLELLRHLSSQHEFVSAKSTSLHTACQHLLEEQTALSELAEQLSLRLVYFTDADRIAQKLQTPAAVANTVNSDSFLQILDRIDECYSHVIEHVSVRRTQPETNSQNLL